MMRLDYFTLRVAFLLFMVMVGASITLDDHFKKDGQENCFYYRADASLKAHELLNDVCKGRVGLKTLDLSSREDVNDKFIKIFSKSEASRTLINIDLSRTKVTKKSLTYILEGVLGTKRNFIKFHKDYVLPVTEVFLNAANSCIKDEDISQFENRSIVEIRVPRTDQNISEGGIQPISVLNDEAVIQGIRVLSIRNKAIPSFRPGMRFKKLPRELPSPSLENLTAIIQRFSAREGKRESVQEKLGRITFQDERIAPGKRRRTGPYGSEKRNFEVTQATSGSERPVMMQLDSSDVVYNLGMIEAESIGKEEGKLEAAHNIASKLLKLNMEPEQISEVTGLSVDDVLSHVFTENGD